MNTLPPQTYVTFSARKDTKRARELARQQKQRARANKEKGAITTDASQTSVAIEVPNGSSDVQRAKQQILKRYRPRAVTTYDHAAQKLGIDKSTIEQAFVELREEGELTPQTQDSAGRWYRLDPKHQSLAGFQRKISGNQTLDTILRGAISSMYPIGIQKDNAPLVPIAFLQKFPDLKELKESDILRLAQSGQWIFQNPSGEFIFSTKQNRQNNILPGANTKLIQAAKWILLQHPRGSTIKPGFKQEFFKEYPEEKENFYKNAIQYLGLKGYQKGGKILKEPIDEFTETGIKNYNWPNEKRLTLLVVPPESPSQKWKIGYALGFQVAGTQSALILSLNKDHYSDILNQFFLPPNELDAIPLEADVNTLMTEAAKSYPPLKQAISPELDTPPKSLELSTKEFQELLEAFHQEDPQFKYEVGELRFSTKGNVTIALPKDVPLDGQSQQTVKINVGASPQFFETNQGVGTYLHSNEPLRDLAITVGNMALRLSEAENILQANDTDLMRVRGHWIMLDRDQLEAAIQFLKDLQENPTVGNLTRRRIGRTDLIFESNNEYLESVLAQLDGNAIFKVQDHPEGFRPTEDFQFQRLGMSFLKFMTDHGMGALLVDDVGLGKTPQTLGVMLYAANEAKSQDRKAHFLVVTESSLIGNWQDETRKFTPLKAASFQQLKNKANGDLLQAITKNDIDVVVTSYDEMRANIDRLNTVPWQIATFDEAEHISNPDALTTQAAYRLQSKSKIGLTATPLRNHMGEVATIVHVLNPGVLGSLEDVRKIYHRPYQAAMQEQRRLASKDRLNPQERQQFDRAMARTQETIEKFQRDVRPFILGRTPEDVEDELQLPPVLERVLESRLSTSQTTEYGNQLSQYEQERLKGNVSRDRLLTHIMRLRQISNHPLLDKFTAAKAGSGTRRDLLQQIIENPSPKMVQLLENAEQIIGNGECLIVCSDFASMGFILERFLEDKLDQEVLFIHGGTKQQKRHEIIREFEKSDGPPVIVLSKRAASKGLNLQRANHVFMFDPWWNEAANKQIVGRARRIGQKADNVHFYRMKAANSIEKYIFSVAEFKQMLADKALADTGTVLKDLSTNFLRDVLDAANEDYKTFAA